MRKESNSFGDVEIDDHALYDIHAYRAKQNFRNESLSHIKWCKAVGIVKQAA